MSDASSRITSFVIPTGVSSATEIAFALRVTDERDAATSDDLVVYVELGVNDAADGAHAGSDQVVDEGAESHVAWQCDETPEGGRLLYRWEQTGGIDVGLGNPTSSVATCHVADAVGGDGDVGVRSDDDGHGAMRVRLPTVSVEVLPGENDAPLADAGDDQVVDEGEMVTLDGDRQQGSGERGVAVWLASDRRQVE